MWFGILAILAAVVALPFVLEWRRAAVVPVQLRGKPGRMARLSDGATYYRWRGDPKGPVAVLVHGLTTASYVWLGVARGLETMGFRVLTYDLYGRGFSDRPKTPQDRDFFIRQLRELLENQKITENVVLVGYSMGGAIATAFAAEEPGRVERLILLAPAGLVHNPTYFAEFCRRVPVAGDWLNTVLGGWWLRRGLKPGPSAVQNIEVLQAAETRTRGFLPSILSSQRNMLAEDLTREHAALKHLPMPVLAVWGEQDPVIPLIAVGRLSEANRNAMQVTVPGAGHGLPHTHSEEVIEAVQGFLKAV